MKTQRLFVLLLAACLSLLTPRPAAAQAELSFDFFYDSLTPYGEWIEVADYGSAWRPTAVDEEWAPYTDGYWAFTDAGWTWVSYEDFGGIVYHYGRWVRVEDEGWCWVPDYEWAPAWVSWRQNDDYVGWAPLPPEARWRPSVGISIWVDREYDIGPGYYNFCRVRDFGAPVLRGVIVNRNENVTIIRRTTNITNITYNTTYVGGPVIYNGGPTYAVINQRSSRRIPALKLVREADYRFERRSDDDRRERRHDFNARAVGNQLVVTAPTVRPPSQPDWMKGRTKKVVAADKVTRGWSGVRSEEVRRELRQEMQSQTRGRTPETMPARQVAKTDLQAVPVKADPKAASPVADAPERRDRMEKRDRSPDPKTPATADVAPTSPTTTDVPPTERAGRERGRGTDSPETTKPVTRAPGLKPFNPAAETERDPRSSTAIAPTPGATQPADGAPAATPDPRQRPDRSAEQPAPKTRERGVAEQPKRVPPSETDGEKMRRSPEKPAREAEDAAARQAEAQRKAEFMRQRQMEENGARQKQQAEAERVARQQAEAAAAQRRQSEMQQQRSAEEAARSRAAEQSKAQEMDARRRQQSEQQAAEQQQRRQLMEQQRAAQEAGRQQAEKAGGEQRRKQERPPEEQNRRPEPPQREQSRPRDEGQRPQREMQRPPQPAAAPAEPAGERRGRDRDKDKDKDR